MTPMSTPELLRVAGRVVWFKPPEEALRNPVQFLNHALTWGTVADLQVVRAHFLYDDLRESLREAHPGVFDARSWNYWHFMPDMGPAPPLPTRNLGD